MRADCCGQCGTQLQALEPTTLHAQLALEESTRLGLTLSPLALALVAHVSVVHDELAQLPALVPFTATRGKRP